MLWKKKIPALASASDGPTAPARAPRFSDRYKKRRIGLAMALNLTPMIDIVFLLLFFFLAVSRFHEQEGMLPGQLPAQAAGISMEVPQSPIRVRFSPDHADAAHCEVTVDRFQDQPLAVNRLSDLLEKIRDEIPGYTTDTPVHLLADDKIAWGHVVNAYNAALAAGFEKIYFVGSS